MESQGEFLTKEIQLLAQSSANQLEKERIDSPNRFEGSSVEKCRILTDANPKFIEKRGADNISRELKEPLSLSKQENAGGPHGPVEFDEQVEMPSELRSTAWSKDPANEFQVKMGDSTMQEQSNPLVMFAQLVPLARQKSSRPTRARCNEFQRAGEGSVKERHVGTSPLACRKSAHDRLEKIS